MLLFVIFSQSQIWRTLRPQEANTSPARLRSSRRSSPLRSSTTSATASRGRWQEFPVNPFSTKENTTSGNNSMKLFYHAWLCCKLSKAILWCVILAAYVRTKHSIFCQNLNPGIAGKFWLSFNNYIWRSSQVKLTKTRQKISTYCGLV